MKQPTFDDICRRNHGGEKHSEGANRRAAPSKRRDQHLILSYLAIKGAKTCDEVEVALEMKHQTCSARFAELKRSGAIRQIGRRPTRSGCMAGVWGIA